MLGGDEGIWSLSRCGWEGVVEGGGAQLAVMLAGCWFNGKRAEGIERCHGWLEWRKALKTRILGADVA